MRVKLEDLDRVASDLANVNTSGYKAERSTTASAERQAFTRALNSAIDVTEGERSIDFRAGVLNTTGRDLDVALDGTGFFEIQTPEGIRYTRDGSFTRGGDGTLTTRDGYPVMGDAGAITLGKGRVEIGEDGTIRTGETVAGRLKVVTFAAPGEIERESGARFRAATGITPAPSTARVVGGSLEAANVSVVERVVALTEIKRAFEGLQKGLSILNNEIDSRAITELGRR
jgi:flagellar basal-body rod protein FlgF